MPHPLGLRGAGEGEQVVLGDDLVDHRVGGGALRGGRERAVEAPDDAGGGGAQGDGGPGVGGGGGHHGVGGAQHQRPEHPHRPGRGQPAGLRADHDPGAGRAAGDQRGRRGHDVEGVHGVGAAVVLEQEVVGQALDAGRPRVGHDLPGQHHLVDPVTTGPQGRGDVRGDGGRRPAGADAVEVVGRGADAEDVHGGPPDGLDRGAT